MKTQLPPHNVSSLTFPASPFNYTIKNTLNSDTQRITYGNFSQDGMWVWLVKGGNLEIFSTHDMERCSSWSLSAIVKDGTASITSVVEFKSADNPAFRLIIAADWGITNSLLCLYDVKMSKILKAIEFPSKITSLDIISSQTGTLAETCPLSKELCYMFGVISVGTADGHIFLLDLNLDDDNYCSEIDPNTITFITQQTHNIMGKRKNALIHYQHLCLLLNDDGHHRGYFQYRDHDNSPLATFSTDEASVTALKFFRNVMLLAAGFNFGGVQLWNMSTLSLQYSCSLDNNMSPVIKFAFQEPENDPKNFCYFWVIRGCEEDHPDLLTVAYMYSLSYSKKEWIDNYGFLYQGLQNCCLRFEYSLSTDDLNLNDNMEVTSRLISCYTIQQADILSIGRPEHEDALHNEDWNNSPDYSLCILAWEAWDETESNSICYLVIFDMNQWYKAQMPSRVRWPRTEICPFLGVFSLSQVTEQISNAPLLNLQIKANTLAKFKSLSNADEFYYPISLSFNALGLSEIGLVLAEYFGCHRMILSEMTSIGPKCILEPKTLHRFCEFTGLITQKQVPNLSVTSMRESLLSVALENNLSYFLSSCIQSWCNGEFAHVGCTLKLIFDWSWKKVAQIKTSIDKLCVPLFNCSGQELDHSRLRLLHHYVSQLQMLVNIFQLLQKQNVPIREQGESELDLKKEVTQLIATYLQVTLWLYDCNLLPEYIEGEAYGENEVAFPVSVLYEAFSSKRQELQKLHSTIGQTDVLLIDGIISDMGTALSNQWEKSGWNGVYPPPSFNAVLNTYLIPPVSMQDKHQLMLYVLLDMAAFLSDRQSHLVEKFMKFPAAFRLNLSHVKITHGFWLLDHQNFEEAINVLLEPMINSLHILPWQHIRIMKAFLYQGEHKKAMKYCYVRNPPHQTAEEVKLYLTILLANGLISEAFHFQRKFRDQGNSEDLLNHLFLGCQQTHTLDILFQLHLNPVEKDALLSFLHNNSDPMAQELLIMYFLQQNRPVEAIQLNEKLKSQIIKQDHEKAAARNSLVNGSMQILPKVQSRLLNDIGFQSTLKQLEKRQIIQRPQPLSTSVKMKNLKMVSHSDLHRAVIDKVKEIHEMSSFESFSPLNKSTKEKFWRTESVPFVETPLFQNKFSRSDPKEVVFATPVIRHINLSNERDSSVSPSKKSRFLDITPLRSSINERRKSFRNLSGEISSLLQTPPIYRKTPIGRSKLLDSRSNEIGTTPHSILKVKNGSSRLYPCLESTRLTQNHFNVFEKSEAKDNESVNQSDITDQEEDTSIKQLRFKVPELKSSHIVSGKWLTPSKSILRNMHEKNFGKERTIECSTRPPLHNTDNIPSSPSTGNELYKLPENMELEENPPMPHTSYSFNKSTETVKKNDTPLRIISPIFKPPKSTVFFADVKDSETTKETAINTPEIEMKEETKSSESLVIETEDTNQIVQMQTDTDDNMKIEKQNKIAKDKVATQTGNLKALVSDSESEYEECLKEESTDEKIKMELHDSDMEVDIKKPTEREFIEKDKSSKDSDMTPPISPIKTTSSSPHTPEKDTSRKYTMGAILQSSPFEGTRSRSRSKSKSPSSSHLKDLPSHLTPVTEKSIKVTSRSKNKETTESKQAVRSTRKSKKDTDETRFTFSDPNIAEEPVGMPEFSTPQATIPSFVFSPPLTRSRSRQKKTDESFISSSSILIGDTSYRQKKSAKEEMLDDTFLSASKGTSIKADVQTKKKTLGKKKRNPKIPDIPTSQDAIKLISPATESVSESAMSVTSQNRTSTVKHSMTLRKLGRPFRTRKFVNL